MQVHQTPQNKGPKVTANLVQRLTLAEKKIEQLQSMFADPVAFFGGVQSPDSSLVGVSPLAEVDTTSFSTASSTPAQLTNAWDIPAGDAIVNTAYRLTAYGFGTVGSTTTLVSFVLGAYGAFTGNTGLTSVVSTSFAWKFTGTLVVVSPISAHFETDGIATFGAVTGGRATSTTSTSFNANALSVSISASSDTTLMMQGAFGTPGSGSSLTCNLSIFERL